MAAMAATPFEPRFDGRHRVVAFALPGADSFGTLVLAGAGMFGKEYCATARQNGAFALDLRSAFASHGPWIKTKQA
jgi:hypothetical protein